LLPLSQANQSDRADRRGSDQVQGEGGDEADMVGVGKPDGPDWQEVVETV
jgi:hypothetical protein